MLSDKQVKEYKENGFVIMDYILPKETLDEIKSLHKNLLDKHPEFILPSKVTNVPSPAGTTEPVKENPKTALPLAETVNPAAAASPPPAETTSTPVISNWKP